MRKKMFIFALMCALSLWGCSGEEKEEKVGYEEETKASKIEDVADYYELVENVDFSKSHIKVNIRDGLAIDADISNDVPREMGVYEVKEAEDNVNNEEEYDAFMGKFIKCIDDYFGKDVTITAEEAVALGDANKVTAFYTGFDIGNNTKYYCSSEWDVKYSYLDSEYNKEEMDAFVEGFVEHFKEFLPVDISTNYSCVHFNDEYWTMVEEKSNRERKDFENSNMNYYMIRIYPEVEIGTYIKDNSYVDILLNEQKELIAFLPKYDINVGECIQKNNVLNAHEMLEKYYELYAYNPVYMGITVREMKLEYRLIENEATEGNEADLGRLEPVWCIKYTKSNMLNCKTEVFSAFTGELIERMD